jgi:hypothetical protein
MNNAGTIGATVIIGGSGHALADDNTTVGQKRLSWYTAKDKATVESAGHNSLIVEGMSLPDIVLSVTTVNGKPAVVEGESGKMLKATGKILSLTGKEAVACGLAVGTADSVAECLAVLGADKATEGKAASNQAEGLFKERATAIRAASNSYNGLLDKVKDNIAVVRAERAAVDPRKRISSIKIIEESLTVAIVLAKRYPTLCDRGTMSYPEDLQRILDEWVALRKQAEAKK